MYAFDADEVLEATTSRLGNLIQVIEGTAEIVINEESKHLESGQSIIIPAHANCCLKADARFKIVSTIIKSGYEEMA